MRPTLTIILISLIFSIASIAQRRPSPERAAGFTISFPWINNFSFYDYERGQSGNSSGFIGLGSSLYYKTTVYKISISVGITTNLPVPLGPYDREMIDVTTMNMAWVEGTYHKRIAPRINLIGGLHYAEYEYSYFKNDSVPSYSVDDYSGGLTTGVEYLFGRKNFSLALFYRPAIITNGQFKYRHLICLDARIDINMIRSYF